MNIISIFARINAWMATAYATLTAEDILFMAWNTLS